MITNDQNDFIEALEAMRIAGLEFQKARAAVRHAEDIRRVADERWRAALATVEALRRELTTEEVA